MADANVRPSRAKLVGAYGIVYVIWGSTYLAIAYAIEGLPPFFMAAVRFLIAGTGLFLWARARGAPIPTRLQWRHAAAIGVLLLLGGNGGVVWAEQHVPSGIVALLVAIEPLWIAVLEWVMPGGRRPPMRTIAGLLIGLVGVGVLVGPGALSGAGNVDPVGALVVVLAALSWAAGSLWSTRAPKVVVPSSGPIRSAMQMISGGAALLMASAVAGEIQTLGASHVTISSVLAFLYLLIFGSIVAFSAYAWLLKVEPPTRVSTYAFVNPAVAVLLGWLIASEPLTSTTLFAAAIIVAAVVLIVTGHKPTDARAADERAAAGPGESRPESSRAIEADAGEDEGEYAASIGGGDRAPSTGR